MSIFTAVTASDLIFVGSGIIGMISHYIKKVLRNETVSKFKDWFWGDNLNASITTIGAFVMAMLGALSSGVITPDATIWTVIFTGLTTGFAIDSGFNSGMGCHSYPIQQ